MPRSQIMTKFVVVSRSATLADVLDQGRARRFDLMPHAKQFARTLPYPTAIVPVSYEFGEPVDVEKEEKST